MLALFAVSALSFAGVSFGQLTCKSGEAVDGGSCAQVTGADACEYDAVPKLATINPPNLLEGEVANAGNLSIVVLMDTTADRVVTAITMSDKAECNYPGALWTKSVTLPGCQDSFTAQIPWTTAYVESGDQETAACGLNRTEDAEFVIFYGEADVDFEDQLPAIRGVQQTRFTRSTMRFQLRFPKQAEVSTVITVFDDARVLSAITTQVWNSADNNATYDLLTDVQWPFRLANPVLQSSPDGITSDLQTEAHADCSQTPATNDTSCTQTWRNFLTPGVITDPETMEDTPVCQLDGNYTYQFDIVCHTSIPAEDCPIDANGETVVITGSLDSENLCAIVSEDVGVSLGLSTHETWTETPWAFGDEKKAFFQDQTVNFKLTINSDDGFNLEQTVIDSVTVSDNDGTDVEVYTAAGGATAGWAFETTFNDPAGPVLAHEHHFSYVPSDAAFGDVEVDSSQASITTVVVNITFDNTGPATRKRLVFSTRQQNEAPEPVSSETSAQIALAAAVPADTDGTNTVDITDVDGESAGSIASVGIAAVVGALALNM